MFALHNVTLRRGANVLLQNINWTVYPKQRIGIIGANGSGKTSLFLLLLQSLHADTGEVEIGRGIKIAHVAQETPGLAKSALEFVLDGDEEFSTLSQRLKHAEAAQDGVQIAALHEKLAVIDGYTANARAAELLAGLGFSQAQQQKCVSEFSGGWRVRLNLAKALMCRSDILLLDEPTNHLDLDAVLWIEQWLLKYPGTLLLISHDRDFLDSTVDNIAFITQQNLQLYAGNYSTFEKERAQQLLHQQAAYEKQQKQLAHMQSFVDRFRYKATKAKQAQSRLKAMQRMELICAVQTESPFQFNFINTSHAPNPLIKLQRASISYGDKVVLSHLNLSISPKERIAILGPNGAGKSSLIKLLAGEIEPSSGVRETAAKLRVGYFAQHQVDTLKLNESAFDHMRDIDEKSSELELRKFLGSFDFSGDKVFEPVKNFSGGEKARLALALLIWQQPNLLLLDEPTNHLDLDMRTALSIALQSYDGAMLLVTHDRFLVRSTVDELWLVADGDLQQFNGDLNDYQKWLFEYKRQQNSNSKNIKTANVSRKEQRQQEAKTRDAARPLMLKIDNLEKDIKRLTQQLDEIHKILADSHLYEAENKAILQKHLIRQTELKKNLANKEIEWLTACEQRDK